jgi:RNA polymerase sigma factor (sigma-70 family)
MSDAPASDSDLWRRAAAGEAQALTDLASLARRIGWAELERKRAESHALEDLVQEVVRSTLAFVARLGGSGEEPRDLRAFLKFRAWGVLSDHRKHMRVALPQVDAELAPERAAREPSPERAASRAQLVRALFECKEKLGDEQRVTLELRYAGHKEADEIARELGLHRNTVHVRVFRALAQLRDCLTRKGFDPEDLET